MDRGDVRQTAAEFFRKYRWAALVLAVGLLMMSFPEHEEQMVSSVMPEVQQEESLQEKLEELLSGLDGAGKVKVLLSISTGERKHYHMDEDTSRTADTVDQRKEAVIITSGDREEHGLLLRTDPPTYSGAVVLCQGADSARVKLAVVEAVSTATGLGSDKISVLKMK